jgi:hypothetical protein
MSETVFWFNSTGAGETSQLEFERPISEPVLFRATTIAAWLNTTQRIDFRQDLTLFHKLDDRHAFMYQASAIGVSEPNAVVSDFVILLLYRYRLHRNWMFLEVSPQLHFPKEFNFHKSPMLSMRLEMLLDQTQ